MAAAAAAAMIAASVAGSSAWAAEDEVLAGLLATCDLWGSLLLVMQLRHCQRH